MHYRFFRRRHLRDSDKAEVCLERARTLSVVNSKLTLLLLVSTRPTSVRPLFAHFTARLCTFPLSARVLVFDVNIVSVTLHLFCYAMNAQLVLVGPPLLLNPLLRLLKFSATRSQIRRRPLRSNHHSPLLVISRYVPFFLRLHS